MRIGLTSGLWHRSRLCTRLIEAELQRQSLMRLMMMLPQMMRFFVLCDEGLRGAFGAKSLVKCTAIRPQSI